MRDKEEKIPELAGIDPTKPFYMAVSIDNLDGSFTEPAGIEGVHLEHEAAIAQLEEMIEEYNMTGFVFHCVPVTKVARSKVRKINLAPPPRSTINRRD